MDISGIGAFRTYRYLTTLAEGGDRNQALLQALAAGQPQAAEAADVLGSATAVSPLASLAGQGGGEALGALAYTASAATGQGPEALASLLAALSGNNTALLFPSAALPLPAATALAAYGYGQSEDPRQALAQLTATGRKALATTGLDLLA